MAQTTGGPESLIMRSPMPPTQRTILFGERNFFYLALVLIFVAAFIFSAFLIAHRWALSDLKDQGNRQLEVIASDLESALAKFETLPYAVSWLPDASHVLTNPADILGIARLNHALQAIQRQSKVSAIYLMDRRGLTIASSNWADDASHSFIGRNFAYRPYFIEAMAGHAGHFYGIGNATGEPGYFLTQPVYEDMAAQLHSRPLGALAVKISLDEFERAWHASREPIALADASGVIFLSNRTGWKYRSLRRLSEARRQELKGTQQYGGQLVEPISSLAPNLRGEFGDSVQRTVGPLGWHLLLYPRNRRATNVAALWALATALLIAAMGLGWGTNYQRRRRLQERITSRDALQRAADELEQVIVERTHALVCANQDIENRFSKLQQTERMLRSTQDELVQAGKLAMLGQMAAGVTHELNQPLAAIRAFADNAGMLLERGQISKAADNLGHIAQASARMGSIIHQLKGFSRISDGVLTPVDIHASVEVSIFLLQGEFDRQRVTLCLELQRSVMVAGDAVRIEQVLINLLRNALDAVEEAFEKKIFVHLNTEGAEAVIMIRDSGPGIGDGDALHIFEPFFTTKPSGQGLGLGLAISSSIVQAMKGSLIAINHPEGGAQFTLRLPLYEPPPGDADESP